MLIAVLNKSTRVSDAEIRAAVAAVAHQVFHHVAPAWGGKLVSIMFTASTASLPAGSYAFAVMDDADRAGIPGRHARDAKRLLAYGEVLASRVLDNGGTALDGPLSVSAMLSHEVLETYVDPHGNLWADDRAGRLYALEVCDPVEDSAYRVQVAGRPVSVSDFVLPHWFDPRATADEPFAYSSDPGGPFQLAPGGSVIRRAGGRAERIYGERFPEWAKAGSAHESSRLRSRIGRGWVAS